VSGLRRAVRNRTAVPRYAFLLAGAGLFTASGFESAAAQSTWTNADTATSPDGIPIVYEVHGEGARATPALVFAHGWSCDRTYWAGQLRPFSRHFKVVALDLVGHGESGLGRSAWTIEAFGGDVAAVVNKLGLEHVILIGHSMGGDVVTAAARRLPGRFTGLIWIDTYKQLRKPHTPEEVEALLAPLRADFVDSTRALVRSLVRPTSDSSLVERIVADMSSAPPAVAIEALESSFGYSREIPGALQELKLPVVAINTDSPPTDIPSMKGHGVKVVVMPRVSHFMMMEDPERFNRVLRGVIDTLVR
jgi:pimeloyl-ACP methyl ester carboxylesterase